MTKRDRKPTVLGSEQTAVKRNPLTAFSAGAVIGMLGGLIGLGVLNFASRCEIAEAEPRTRERFAIR